MKAVLRLVILLTSTFDFLSCLGQDTKVDSLELFNKENFGSDTLYIETHFMECGEWGGHLEMTTIYLKENSFYWDFKRYSADCDKISDKNPNPPQTLTLTKSRKLSNNNKLIIQAYMHQLMDAKYREPTYMNAGYVFEIKNSDMSINIHVYTWGQTTKNEYLTFIKTLLD